MSSEKLRKISGMLQRAAQSTGRSKFALLREIVHLRLSLGRLGIEEYFDFRLYEQDLTLAEKQAFAGYRAQRVLEELLVDEYSKILSLDKISFYTTMKGAGLAIPKMLAVFDAGARPGEFQHLKTYAELQEYFLRNTLYPIYVKPSFGSYGRGNALVVSVHGGRLNLGDGSSVDLGEFCLSLRSRSGFGWILQEPLFAHPDIADLCGPKVSGVRVHTFLSNKGPVVTRAIWKINVGQRDSDNFQHGASGNMLAMVDIASGCIARVVSGVGSRQIVDPIHPTTGRRLVGFKLPKWQEVLELVKLASPAFPGYVCPGWDIAICSDGPRILEVNTFGDIDLSQHSYRRGFLDEDFRNLLRERGLDKLLFGRAANSTRNPRNTRLGRRKQHWDW